jgi:hypothetical protein
LLAQLAAYSLPKNMGNNPLSCLKSIFLTWLPQTLGSIEQRRAAIEKVIEENADIGWQLLMEILPDGHQSGSYNQKPVWREWLDSNWKEGVSRQEMIRQVQNYAELAVRCALKDNDKLAEIISRWANLPPQIFNLVLAHLETPAAREMPEEQRFIIWQKLADEIDKHRRFASADWAMPEEELKKLETAAETIKPENPAILYQRLFNDYEHHFFTSEANYDEQREALAVRRSQAVSEIIKAGGLEATLTVAKSVKLHGEVGLALGRIADSDTDTFLLATHLGNEDKSISEMVRGYIWARYFTASFTWVQQCDIKAWSPDQIASFFSAMPFEAQVWRYAEQALGDNKDKYWGKIFPNTFQAGGDLIEAVSKAIENKRGDIAVDGIGCLMHNKKPFPTALASAAIICWIENYSQNARVQHEAVEVIRYLQSAIDADEEELRWIEFQLIEALDHSHGASPVMLERHLSKDPKFFHVMLTKAYIPESEIGKPRNPSPEEQGSARHVFRLLHRWRTPPGSTLNQTMDVDNLKAWIEKVKELSQQSGHWAIAQQLIGQALTNSPAGIDGLLRYVDAAKVLDGKDFEEMRRGFGIAILNSRGVHGFSQGKEERDLAESYRNYANKYDLAGCPRIAAELRNIANSYQLDSEREAARDPYGM